MSCGKARKRVIRSLRIAACTVLVVTGCDSISIAPSCPNEMRVSELAPVQANEVKPGAIPTYLWEAFPAEAGEFANPASPTTEFLALEPGEVVIRLTASDGIYQVVSSCTTHILEPTTVEVSLEATSSGREVGDLVSLTCQSVGETEAVSFTIGQVDGPPVELSEVLEGISIFTAAAVGDLKFQCVGESAEGEQSEPGLLDLAIVSASDEPDNANDNTNDNDNGGGRRSLHAG